MSWKMPKKNPAERGCCRFTGFTNPAYSLRVQGGVCLLQQHITHQLHHAAHATHTAHIATTGSWLVIW
jgi:hypothetical protein